LATQRDINLSRLRVEIGVWLGSFASFSPWAVLFRSSPMSRRFQSASACLKGAKKLT